MSERRPRTTSIQVNPELNLVLTKYATDQGITKVEAADRIFNILYPKGVGSEVPLVPPGGDEDHSTEETSGLQVTGGDEEISDQLAGTVKDLRAVRTIKALSSGLNQNEGEDRPLTVREALEMKKFETMFGGGRGNRSEGDPDALDAAFQKYVLPLQQQMKMLEDKVSETKVADAERRASEAEKKLQERDAQEQRQAEMQAFLAPVQGQMKEIGDQVGQLAEKLKPGSSEKPTSEEMKAILALAAEMRAGIAKLSAVGGGGGGEGKAEGIKEYLDGVLSFLDKVQEVGGKFRGGEASGDFDWRGATISTVGEVVTEAIHAYRDVTVPSLGEEENKGEGKGEKKDKEDLSQQLVLRRVYNYAVKKISEGTLQLDPYAASKELNLTPNQVWWAIDMLRKRGMLTGGAPASSALPATEEPGRESTGADAIARAEAAGLLEA